MTISLRGKIALAVISAIGVGLTFLFQRDIARLFMGSLLYYTLAGLFFAAGVLYPYIRQDKLVQVRAAALVVTSVVSYFFATQVAIDGLVSAAPGVPGVAGLSLASFVAAGVVGVALVVVPLAAIAPMKFTPKYLALGILSGVAGGIVANYTLRSGEITLVMLGYACWHTLVCLALYFGSAPTRNRYQAIP